MAAPVLGGILVADEVIDLFLPILFYWVRRRRWMRIHRDGLLFGSNRSQLACRLHQRLDVDVGRSPLSRPTAPSQDNDGPRVHSR